MEIFKSLSYYTRRAIWGGLISLAIIIVGSTILGNLGGYEAKQLLKNSLSGINMLCNTVILASATILALLLTVLGLSSGAASKLKEDHYKHIMQIAKLDTAVFVTALVTFVLFNLPVSESEQIPTQWYSIIYYASLVMTSLLGASLITVVLMLYNTVTNIIKIVGLGLEDHPLAVSESEENKDEE